MGAQIRGERVSHYVFTDDEKELRDRAWRFIMPAHERSLFERSLVELARSRVLPVTMVPHHNASYYHALMHELFRSPASRYQRIAEDATADARLIGPFATVAKRVMAADRVRLRSLAFVQELAEGDAYGAAARVAENRCLVAWVRWETLQRIESYRYALEHLLIGAPQTESVIAERGLRKLVAHQRILDEQAVQPLAEAACGGAPDEVIVHEGAPATPGRAIVTKG